MTSMFTRNAVSVRVKNGESTFQGELLFYVAVQKETRRLESPEVCNDFDMAQAGPASRRRYVWPCLRYDIQNGIVLSDGSLDELLSRGIDEQTDDL